MSTVKTRPAKARKRKAAQPGTPRPRGSVLRRAAPGAIATALALGVGAFAVLGSNPDITGAVPADTRPASMPSRPAPHFSDAPAPAVGVPFFAKGADQSDLASVTITAASYQGTGTDRELILDVTWTPASGTTSPDPGFFKVSADGRPAPFHPLASGQLPLGPLKAGNSPKAAGKLAYTVGAAEAQVTVVPAFGSATTFPVKG